jgi:PAS domain S-box-containing protein
MLTFRRGVRFVASLAIAVTACMLGAFSNAHAAGRAKQVLVLNSTRHDEQFSVVSEREVPKLIAEGLGQHVDYYTEYFDWLRFPPAEYQRAYLDFLRVKYEGKHFDLLILMGSVAIDFMTSYRDVLFAGTPAVFYSLNPPSSRMANSTGLLNPLHFSRSIDLAMALQPDLKHVYVVSGAGASDRQFERQVRGEFHQFERRAEFTYFSGLVTRDLENRLRTLPAHSAVYYLPVSQDGAGENFQQMTYLSRVAAAANAPTYSWADAAVDSGIVGGSRRDQLAETKAIATLALRVLHGERADDIPVSSPNMDVDQVDWRQLRRWRISEARVPAGTRVLFREPSVWDRYKRYIVGSLALMLAQTVLILGLLVQRSKRRRAEEESRRNGARYRSVVDTQSELICRFLPDTTLTFVNDAYCRFANKTREQLLGTKFIALIPPAARSAVLDRLGRLRQGMDSHEHEVLLPDGTIGWHHWINHTILDDRGNVIELQGVGRDISDRKRAEAALGESEARNRAMLRAIPDLMFVIARDGTYVDYHARDPNLLFGPPSAFIGRKVRDIMPAAIADTVMDAIERACDSQDTVVVEYELPMGDKRHFEARLVRTDADRVLSMVRDVTEAKRAMQLNRDLAGRLIASQEAERQRIARELHDNLSQKIAILNIEIDQIARATNGDDLRSRVRAISEHTGEIASDVRHLSHELHPPKLQLLGLVAALQSLCRDISQQGRVRVVFTHGILPPGIDPNVSLCLYRIAQEALHNVARHSRARHAHVRLTRDADTLVLQIADSGVGFDPQNRQHAGLGLVSMRERVAFVRGELAIHTCPGGGTRIGVRVPVSRSVGAATSPLLSQR